MLKLNLFFFLVVETIDLIIFVINEDIQFSREMIGDSDVGLTHRTNVERTSFNKKTNKSDKREGG